MPSPIDWHIATMGFAYPKWADVFYPEKMKPSDYLPYYARWFDTLELDTTWHASPAPDTIKRWRDVTPDYFRFTSKVPKAITHEGRLSDKTGALGRFVDLMSILGDKLAVLLLQFPPTFDASNRPGLKMLLSGLPAGPRFAAEFRHASWRGKETAELLRAANVCLVANDYDDRVQPIIPTTDFLYLRFVGVHDRFERKNVEEMDTTERLSWWRERVIDTGIPKAFVYFNNDYAGYSIATAERLKRMVGVPVAARPPAVAPTLFG